MADKSPRQHQSKGSGKTVKEKRNEKKAKQAGRHMTTAKARGRGDAH